MTLGDKIKQLRESKNYSQEELADLLKVHSVTISKWESGTQEPRAKRLNELAKIFGVSNEYLLDDMSIMREAPYEKDRDEGAENKLGLSYWGSVADNAQRVAQSGDIQKLTLVAALLQSALNAITNAGVNLVPHVVGVNGNHNSVRDIVNVAGAV